MSERTEARTQHDQVPDASAGLSGFLRRVADCYDADDPHRRRMLQVAERVNEAEDRVVRAARTAMGVTVGLGALFMMKSFTPRV